MTAASPFAPADLYAGPGAPDASGVTEPRAGATLLTPFAESMTAGADDDLAAEAASALLAELDDEEFTESLQALVDEAAGRHLRSIGTWSPESSAPVLATAETEQWLESVLAEADGVLGRLEEHFADRSVDTLRDGEVDAAAGLDQREDDPLGAQEQFIKSLVDKARKVAQGAAKLAKKGLRVAGRFLPVGVLFGLLRRLVKPLLRRVLHRAVGRLPAPLRPLATQLATRFAGRRFGGREAFDGREAQAPAGDGPDVSLAEEFDQQLAELVLAPNEAAVDQALAEADPADAAPEGRWPLHELDAARARLARQLAEADPGQPLAAQVERFIPAVMAAMPAIRAGIGIVGRERVVSFLGGAVEKLIKGMVGAQAARLLSRHLASTGLGLLGLEADDGTTPTAGTEALVAAVEDTVREVLSLPPEMLSDELLLEAETQDAFTAAAARHLPAAVLRPEVVEEEAEGEHAMWVLMPRATRPCFRYTKYSRVIPLRVSRPVARSVVFPGGDTLERRLLDAGARSWPVPAEMEVYELLAGAEPGHLAAYEADDPEHVAAGVREFEELTTSAATLLAGNPGLARAGRRSRRRFFRVKVGGRPLRRRGFFALRLDLTSPQPVLAVHLRVGEHDAHALAGHLERRQLSQVVSTVRRLVGPAVQQRLGQRLARILGKHGVQLASGAGTRLAGQLADAMVSAVSGQLPAAAATLARAAKDPAPGVTLTFRFTFPDKAAIGTAAPASPTLTIRPGQHRG